MTDKKKSMERVDEVSWGEGKKNRIVLFVQGDEAKSTYHTYFMRQFEKLRRDMALKNSICCAELKAALGKHDRHYPVLAFISEGAWADGRGQSMYHGATGPGFYGIYNVVTRHEQEEMITYVPLFSCPFCFARLDGVK